MYKTPANNQFRDFSGSGTHPDDLKLSYDIDDTMNDSYMDEITDETSRHYNNHDTVKDLKLQHTPNKNVTKRNSYSGMNNQVKMVKKYVPTPNGIKVIEVPEVNMQKEISRNNSIRSGANIPRTNSINSLSAPRTARRQPSSRLSSLVKSPPLVEEEPKPDHTAYDLLQKKIDEEKEFQRKLEAKRLEYEELKRKRLVDEHQLKQMEQEMNNDMSKFARVDDSMVIDSKDMLSLNSINEDQELEAENVKGLGIDESYKPEALSKPILNDVSTLDTENDNTFISPVSTKDTESSDYPESSVQVDMDQGNTVDHVAITVVDPPAETGSAPVDEAPSVLAPVLPLDDPAESVDSIDETDAAIDPAKIKVDELEGKKLNTTGDETSLLDDNTIGKADDDFGIEEVALGPDDTPNLNKSGPTFDTVPSIITDNGGENSINGETGLKAPAPFSQTGSSGSSIHSDHSGSPSRGKVPMKSAMKNSSSFYNKNNQPTKNAAQEAYLSLATAENTRLNSKLSAPQLNESNMLNQSHHYPTANPANINRRMSQTLRKPPPNQGTANGGFANRTLRPQSMQMDGGAFPRFQNPNQQHQNNQNLPPPNLNMNPSHSPSPPAQGQNHPHYQTQNHNGFHGPHNGSNGHGSNGNGSNGGFNGANGNAMPKSRMSDRTLRDRNSTYVQPISPHPALQPNYQSLSKAKAAELYAKANRRPRSTFNLQRKSSFEADRAPEGQVMQKTTLREPRDSPEKLQPPHQLQQPPQHPQQQAQQAQQSQQSQQAQALEHLSTPVKSSAKPSRFADSDEDLGTSPASAIFSSRFVDSDDESKGPIKVNHIPPPTNPNRSPEYPSAYRGGGGQQAQILTLRDPPESKKTSKKEAPKEKKKFGKLKKLFGRS